jgi:3',5'-cyclic AMP phosphodiesterase CpdA
MLNVRGPVRPSRTGAKPSSLSGASMRTRILPPVLAGVLLSLAPAAAHAWTYGDTLTTILRPLPNLPALARPGDGVTVWADAGSGTTGWAATLLFGALRVPLAPAGGGWQPTKGRWELAFTVPPGTPELTYGLELVSGATAPDTSAHAVKVIPAFRGDFYFAQISDTHLPEHTFSTTSGINASDTTGMADFDAVIEDLNVIHPEFVIHTGDLVNEGELEEQWGMFEMGRAKEMLGHLEAPVWVSTGNHDIGGWKPTPPPDGFSRKNWWRYYGWKWLENPPAGDPWHSQDFTFDYGPLHVIGLEAYINNGSYDTYRQDLWGAQSFTPEQLSWLQADIAAQPAGTHQLLFYHYDFGGTTAGGGAGANFSQINPATLGIDGAIWGHNHVVAENSLTPRTATPFNLGCRSVIDYRAFRIFRVHDGVMSPGPMHFASTLSSKAVDSLGVAWAAPNDGSAAANSVTLVNRYGEAWDHARVRFVVADHDSTFQATGGTIAQVVRQGGLADVDVDCVIPASGNAVVSLSTLAPVSGVAPRPRDGLGLRAAGPTPFVLGGAPLRLRFTIPEAGRVRLELLDVSGRRVATLFDGAAAAGATDVAWDGRSGAATPAAPGVYLARIVSPSGTAACRVAVVR